MARHRTGTAHRSGLIALLVTAALSVVLSTVLALARAAPAAAQGIDPGHNIPVSHRMSDVQWYFGHTSCQRAPAGSRCENAVIRALNRARAALGRPHYALPDGFESLTPARQMLVLVNDDRRMYGRTPVVGLSRLLKAGAQQGARAYADPQPIGRGWTTAASNWAGGMASGLFAYYSWMYGDGLSRDGSSNNIDCSTSHPGGCWSHRDNILRIFGSGTRIALGVGHADGAQGPSWTQLFQAYPQGRAAV